MKLGSGPAKSQRGDLAGATAALQFNADFRLLWNGLAVSQFGSAVGNTAVPVVAVSVLHASTFQVTLLAASAAVATALLALPIGAGVEFRAKRPTMIAADLFRLAATLSVPIAYLCHELTFAQLCVVAVLNGLLAIAFNSASQANLISLVRRDQLVDANGRLQSTNWLSLSVGPSLGGVLISAFNALSTMVIDAFSYAASAFTVWRIRTPEPAPARRDQNRSRWAELLGGLSFVAHDPVLRRLLISWIIFAGFAGATSPLTSLLYLRELHFSPWQYGLIMGLPSVAGFAGSRLTAAAGRRFGTVPALWLASLLRGPWYLPIAFATRGGIGVAMCCIGFSGVLFFSSLANSAMTGYRQLETPPELMSRVATLWSLATTVGQPLFILLGGALAELAGFRTALVVAALGILLSALILPRWPSGQARSAKEAF